MLSKVSVNDNFEEYRKIRGSKTQSDRIRTLINDIQRSIIYKDYAGVFLYSREIKILINKNIDPNSVRDTDFQRGWFYGIRNWEKQ